jgi:hypothetical protein
MSVISDLRWKWEEMDEIDRGKVWMGLAGLILLGLLVYSLSNTFHVLGGMLGKGASIANQSVSNLQNVKDLVPPGT